MLDLAFIAWMILQAAITASSMESSGNRMQTCKRRYAEMTACLLATSSLRGCRGFLARQGITQPYPCLTHCHRNHIVLFKTFLQISPNTHAYTMPA